MKRLIDHSRGGIREFYYPAVVTTDGPYRQCMNYHSLARAISWPRRSEGSLPRVLIIMDNIKIAAACSVAFVGSATTWPMKSQKVRRKRILFYQAWTARSG